MLAAAFLILTGNWRIFFTKMVERNTLTTQSERLKILFTSTHLTSFIKEDLNLLRKHFAVEHLTTSGISSVLRIPSAVRTADVTFTWFASVYSSFVVFFANMANKKSIVVIGGVDVAKYPEINYGIWLSWWKSILVKYAIRNADKVLVVDVFLKAEAMRLADYAGTNIEYVPTGYDANAWFPSGTKEPFVLTVAGCESVERMKVKGIDFLLSAARELPDVRFVVVGIANHLIDSVRATASANVELIPFVDQKELLDYYQQAKVYCQPSYIEGLPNSVCEAMLCECVPVGTNVGGIPTAIKDIGVLVPYGDVRELREAIQKALRASDNVGQAARSYIAETFSLQRREDALLRIVRGAAN